MSDHCDRCCQDARLNWWQPHGRLTLGFCWHHSRELGPALLAGGFLARPILGPTSDTRPGGPILAAG